MDDLKQFDMQDADQQMSVSWVPPRAPLEITPQHYNSFEKTHFSPAPSLQQAFWRALAFAPPLSLSAVLILGFYNWLSSGGVMVLEAVLIALVGMTFIWVSLSVSSVLIGVLCRILVAPPAPAPAGQGQTIALTMLTYNEDPVPVVANAMSMIEALSRENTKHSFELFLLSDTQDPEIAAQEEAVVAKIRSRAPFNIPVFYRRRVQNTDRKIGNVADWLARWGARYDGFLVLDADSLMTSSAIIRLADRLEADPHAGLIQSFPRLIGAQSMFARMQQFASFAYGGFLSKGLAAWAQKDGNYWGHNAIIRCTAFAQSAHLPKIGRKQKLVMSHDFVEAALLRRAGWSVYFDETATGSYEETPPSLMDHAIRDRRWCRGNLQHLRLLGTAGLSWVSRFHLLQGAVGFLLAPAWLILIIIWSAIELIPMAEHSYFNAANPLYPVWPMMSQIDGAMFLALIYGMLLLPKFLGASALMLNHDQRRQYGGVVRIGVLTLGEVLLSILYAPVLMIQQSRAVLMALSGNAGWEPQARDAQQRSWSELARFHWVETAFGIAMGICCAFGLLSVWMMPVAISLVLAVPLSWLSSQTRFRLGLKIPEDDQPPVEYRRALELRSILGGTVPETLPTPEPWDFLGQDVSDPVQGTDSAGIPARP